MRNKLLNLCLTALLCVGSTSAWALSEVDGFYQIGSAADYAEFAALVNGGQKTISAILTADIDLGTDIDTYKVYVGGDYEGVFDGAGHTITFDFADGTKDNQGPALFRSIGKKAIVKRLKVQGTLTTARQHAAAIANYSGGIIRDCWAEVSIKCSTALTDASAAAFVGQCNKHSVIENCLAVLSIDAPGSHKFGGVAAWSDAQRTHFANNLCLNSDYNFELVESNGDHKSAGLVRNDANLAIVDLDTYNADNYHNRPAGASVNNYVTDNFGFLNKGTEVVTSADVASGKICYQLNSDQSQIRWTQNISTDAYPVPAVFREAGQVYASAATNCQGKAEGDVTFSNTASNAIATAHTYDKYGVCTTCGQFNWNYFDLNDPNKFDPHDWSILINDGDDLFVAECWNRFQNGGAFNMKLTNDVTCKPTPGQVIFNTSDWIESCFNGQGHELTIEMVDIPDQYCSFIPKPYAYSGDFVFENVIMHGRITSTYNNGSIHSGAICSRQYGGNKKIFRNVFCDVNISTQRVGDNTVGGLVGVSDGTLQFDNCIYAGTIDCVEGGTAIAGFVGWANGSTYFNNCAFLGNLTGVDPTSNDTQPFARSSPGAGNCINLYTVNEYSTQYADRFSVVAKEAVESGELAYRLNGQQSGLDRFYQLIGTDKEPMPIKKEGALIYATGTRCDGAIVPDKTTYSNTFSEGDVPSHQYEDGICSICGQLQENYITPVDGWYEIGTPAQLKWMSVYALEHTDVCIRLMADIDYTAYPDGMIGTESKRFTGSFDGQGHTVITDIQNEAQGTGLFGSIQDATIKNLVLEGSVESSKKWIGGIAGITRGDKTLIENVVVKSTVRFTGSGDCTGGGLCGDMEGAFTVKNCAFIGSFEASKGTNVGGLASWTGSGKFHNCYVAPVAVSGESYKDFIHGGGGGCVNCYAVKVSDESLASGELCYKLNGNQFRNPVWYQTLKEDEYPMPFPTHGRVIYGAEQYFSAQEDADIEYIAPEIASYEVDEAEGDIIATQALLDDWKVVAEALGETTTIPGFMDAYDVMDSVKVVVQENAAIYQAYINKCTETATFLENDKTFSGALRNALEYYLSEDVTDEPDEINPLGTYGYIIENHTATDEEIQAETARIEQWLKDAIAEDYLPGTDVSNLIANNDFSKGKEGWTNAWCNSFGKVTTGNEELDKTVGVEAWNATGDMFQTVENLKPGYYLVGTNGAFRPSNNRYSTNYAAGIYANGIFNYFPAVVEDYVEVNDTIDQVNCNLHGAGALDLAIYEDGVSTSGEGTILGYAVHGPNGMAAAANADRYKVYTMAYVGEDGKLTIGIKNPGTKYGNDWTGWSAINVKYLGEEANDAFATVLENMSARAQTIMDYEADIDNLDPNPAKAPNFPVELRNALKDAVDGVEAAETVEAQAKLAATFSELFQEVYEGKRAYINLYNKAELLAILELETSNLPLVEKDVADQWQETGEKVFSTAELDAVYSASSAMKAAFLEGTYSTEEAINPATVLSAEQAEAVTTIMPEQDEDGYYLISNPKQFVAFRALFLEGDHGIKAKLVNDIDMAGIGMQPFGNRTEGNGDTGVIYKGVLDGQNHALENVYISFLKGRRCGLFYELQNATVKNLKLTGEYHAAYQRMGGLTGWTSGNTKIENCEIAVALYTDVTGDATTGGIIGVNGGGSNTVVENCIVNCSFHGEKAHSFGGVCGWKEATLTVKNTLILSQFVNTAEEPSSYQTSIVSRNGYTDGGNVFYVQSADRNGAIKQGTLVTDEQLASGEICYKLNGDQEEINWYQTIGEDEHPMLFGDHMRVWLVDGKYTNNEYVAPVGDLNGDDKVDIADAVTVLNIMAASEYNVAADVNNDGKVDIADFVTILNIMAAQ